jgi:hypothetical protein
MNDLAQPVAFEGFRAVDLDVVPMPSQFVEEHPTVFACQRTGSSESLGAMIVRLDWRLRSEIGIESAERIVARHARDDDVACHHLAKIDMRVTILNHRRESDRSPTAVRVQIEHRAANQSRSSAIVQYVDLSEVKIRWRWSVGS